MSSGDSISIDTVPSQEALAAFDSDSCTSGTSSGTFSGSGTGSKGCSGSIRSSVVTISVSAGGGEASIPAALSFFFFIFFFLLGLRLEPQIPH